MDNNLRARIDALIDAVGPTQAEFANKIGVSANAVTNWKTRGIKSSAYEKIATSYPNVNIDWLRYGDGEMFVTKEGTATRPHIPTSAAAGTMAGFSEAVMSNQCEMKPVVKILPQYDYTITIKGDSMEPKFEGGDIVAIRKVTDFIEWGKTYVLDTVDGAVIKRLYDDGDAFRCVSFNKEYDDFLVKKKSVYGVYKVVGLIRI